MASDKESDETKEKRLAYSSPRLQKLTCEGYGNRFVEDVSDFECAFCCLVARDALQISVCGHSFCTTCWNDWNSSSVDPICCPIDGKPVDLSRVFEDRKHDRIVRGMKVYCDNQQFGCDATPELRDIETHLIKCRYQTVPCDLGCNEMVFLWSVDEHLQYHCPRRVVTCDDCGEQLMACDGVRHTMECPMKVVTCEYCQLGDLRNNTLKIHQETDCPSFPTYCSFSLVGCRDKIMRSDLPTHHQINSIHHLALANSAVCRINDNVGATSTLAHSPPVYELPAPLWGKVGNIESLASVPWTELPACEEMSRSQMSLTDKVELLKKDNRKLTEKVGRLSNICLQQNVKIAKIERANVELRRELNEQPVNDNDVEQINNGQMEINELRINIEDIERTNNITGDKINEIVGNNAKLFKLCEDLKGKVEVLQTESRAKGDIKPVAPIGAAGMPHCGVGNAKPVEIQPGRKNVLPCFLRIPLVLDRDYRDVHFKSWSSPFYTHSGYKLTVLVDKVKPYARQENWTEVLVYVMQGDFDGKLSWPCNKDMVRRLITMRESESREEEMGREPDRRESNDTATRKPTTHRNEDPIYHRLFRPTEDCDVIFE